jgi:hypothetical protein
VAGLRAASGLSRDGAVINIGTLAALNTAGPFIALVDVSKKPIAGVCKRHKIAPPVLPTQATVTRGSEPIENIVRFSTKNEHARPVISLLDGYARSDWKPCWPGHPSGWQPVIDLAATPGDGLDIPGFLGRTTVRNEPMREAA